MKRNNLLFFLRMQFSLVVLLLTFSAIRAQGELTTQRIKKVVIDAGHGGKDPGTIYKTINEKDIVLAVALSFGKLIKEAYPSIEVIYTRDKDIFLELHERSKIANKNNADLFISIHVNSVKRGNNASGSETFVMGTHKSEENLAVARRENAVIMYETDFSTKYQGYDPTSPESYIIFSLMQNTHLDQSLHLASLIQKEFGTSPIKVNRGVKQAGLVVLWGTAMPSVLVELGFLSNENDRKKLTDVEAQYKLSQALLKAFSTYKENYESESNVKFVNNSDTNVVSLVDKSNVNVSSASSTKSAVRYRVQVMSLDHKEPLTSKKFKGYNDVDVLKVGKSYKYTIGNHQSIEEASAQCKTLQKSFKGAFVVAVENGKLVPLKK